MNKVDLWVLMEGQEFYGSLEFDHVPTLQEIGTGVWERYNNMTAYYAQWNEGSTGQADVFFNEENPNYMADFKEKLDNFLG